MTCTPADLQRRGDELLLNWQLCSDTAQLERLVEFAVSVSSFADFLEKQGWSGLQQTARHLEAQILAAFDTELADEIPANVLAGLSDQVKALGAQVTRFMERNKQVTVQRRQSVQNEVLASFRQVAQVWFVADADQPWGDLVTQLGYYGIQGVVYHFQSLPSDAPDPSILLIDGRNSAIEQLTTQIQLFRDRFSASKLIAFLANDDFNGYKEMLRAGCDFCFSQESSQSVVLTKIIDLCSTQAESPYRVLIVEDSPTASKSIEIAIGKGGMTSFVVANPIDVLNGMRQFEPDLVLMDMHMPDCTGVEATRVIRQHPEYLSTPVVYLSGDSDMALQVDALRLGGDHFLTKPFNPVLLNAVVKSKIERYRNLRRSMECDGLTGLFNHRTIKERLKAAVRDTQTNNQPLTVVMIDIDHFKVVNDTYGHPAGDQVLRSLAWLLKLHLRSTDLVGRYGGEEFLVGLPGAESSRAFDVIDRIRHDFSCIKHPFDGGWFSVTFSAGVSYSGHLEQAGMRIKEADAMLYEAKRGGRNCVLPST